MVLGTVAALIFTGVLTDAAYVAARGQEYADLTTHTPLAPGETLVIGFLGGRDSWNDDRRSVRKLALRLRAMNLPGVHIETFENTKRDLALRLVREAFDRNRDGALDEAERASARLLIYGQSFGGAAVVKFARQLEQLGVPVLLTIQIDSVGRGDGVIPANVQRAANLYQRNGWLIRGEKPIRAADPARTEIEGNFQFDYNRHKVDLSHVPFWKKAFRYAHTRMEHDPAVWTQVEELLLQELPPRRDVSESPGHFPLD
jgi:hypothetical protein